MIALLALGVGAAPAAVVDFDALAPGTIVTTLDSITFSLNAPGVDLVVASGLTSTSPPNYLGVADGADDTFLSGDVLGLSFAVSITSLSLVVVTTPGAPPDAFELFSSQGSDLSGDTPDLLLGDDEVYLLSVSSPTPFSSAELRSLPEDVFAFHVDDVEFVPAPEPSAPALALAAAAALAVRSRRSISRPRAL